MSASAIPGGPLPSDFRDTIQKLAAQAKEENQRAEEEARKFSTQKKRFSRLVIGGLSLVAVQLAVLALLYLQQRQDKSGVQVRPRSILPERGCSAVVYRTYWKIVRYMKDHDQRPPDRLEDLVPQYTEKTPFDAGSGKPLHYTTDGAHFTLGCPGAQPPALR